MFGLIILLMSCDEDIVIETSTCEIQVSSYSPSPVVAGDTVIVTGRPFTDERDTLLTLDGVSQRVEEVTRTGCNDCDACRLENLCLDCQDCDVCDPICKAPAAIDGQENENEEVDGCIESLRFTMPSVASSVVGLQVINAYGYSDVISIDVAPAADTSEE